MRNLFFAFFLLVFLPLNLKAKTIYVNKATGSNMNSGLSQVNIPAGVGPLATISAALPKLGMNDTVSIVAGNYDESIVFINDIYVVSTGVIRLKSVTLNGIKSLTKLCSGRIMITDSIQLKNGQLFVQPKAQLFLGLNIRVVGGGQSSFVTGKIFRVFNSLSGNLIFPLGLTHSYRPVSVEMLDNIPGVDTVCVGLIDSNMGNLKLAGVRNFNQYFHGQIQFSKTVNNRYYLTQYFGNYFLNDQVVDTANLKLVYLNSGTAEIGGAVDSFDLGIGNITYLVKATKTVSKFSLCNKRGGANGLGNPGVFAFFKLTKNQFCKGEVIYLENNSTINGSSRLHCVWYINYPKTGKRNSLTDNNANYILRDTGKTEIWLVVTDSLSRVDTFISKIYIKPVLGKIAISSVCRDTKSKMSVVGLSDKDYSVSWYLNDVFSTMDDTLYINKLVNSNYRVRASIQSLRENCDYLMDSFLIVSVAPEIQNIYISDSCNNKYSYASALVKANSLDKITSYLWTMNNSAISNKSFVRFINDSLSPQKIRLSVFNQFNCTTVKDTFVVKNIMKIDSLTVKLNCFSNELSVTNYFKKSSGISHTTQWFHADSMMLSKGSASDKITLSRAKIHGFIKAVTNSSKGCKDSSIVSITPYSVADLQLSSKNTSICTVDTMEFWVKKGSVFDAFGEYHFKGVSYTNNPLKIIDEMAGEKRIVWKTTKYGCSDSLVIRVSSADIPAHRLEFEDGAFNVCINDNKNLRIVDYKFSDTINYRYSMYNNVVLVPFLHVSNVGFSSVGKQRYYSVIEHKASGCLARDTFDFEVFPNPELVVVWDSVLCEDKPLSINLFTGSNAGTGKLTWYMNILGSTYTDSLIRIPRLAAGTYLGQAKVKDALGCWDSMGFSTKINKLPDYTFAITGQMPICPGDSLMVDLNSSDGDVLWPNFGFNPGSVVFKGPGRYKWEIQGFNNCNYGEEFTVVADTTFKLSVTKDTLIASGASVIISASGAVSYAWTPKKYMRYKRGNAILVKPTNNITYKVIGVSDLGCELSDSVKITVKTASSAVKIPNVVTPNGDGLNDVWDLSVVRDIESCIIRIYDSNNVLITELENYENNFSFKEYKPGLYFYSISRKSNVMHKGSLEVFK